MASSVDTLRLTLLVFLSFSFNLMFRSPVPLKSQALSPSGVSSKGIPVLVNGLGCSCLSSRQRLMASRGMVRAWL
ncbi:hypothetical protein D3C81_2231570 [compost metagenome]